MDWAAEYVRLLTGYEGDWQDQALCRDMDNAIFFPDRGQLGRKAMAVCQVCPVQFECLEFALETEQAHGIWGGKTQTEREVMLEMRKRRAAVEAIQSRAEGFRH